MVNEFCFDYLMFVPPTESGYLVKNFAQKLSEHLKIPLSCNVKKNKFTEPQKIFQTSVLKRDNVKNVFSCNNSGEIKGKSILLFDDIYDSGATIKEIGKYLFRSKKNSIPGYCKNHGRKYF